MTGTHVGRALVVIAVIAAAAPHAAAQERAPSAERARLPREVAQEVAELFNAPTTERRAGPTRVPADSTVAGDLAVEGGSLTVAGRVTGRVVVVNGDVLLEPGARLDGDLLIVGGTMRGRDDAYVGGAVRVYRERLRYERRDGRIAADTGNAEDEEWWRRWRYARRNDDAKIIVTAARTYNRVEAMPIHIGPRIRHRRGNDQLLFEALGIFRPSQGWRWNEESIGHRVRAEWQFGERRGVALGGQAYDVVEGVEPWTLPDEEVALAAAIVQRDFRDYWVRHGGRAYARLFDGRRVSLSGGYAHERWRSARAHNVWSLFDRDDGWRPNPAMDEGRVHLATASLAYDTRNSVEHPRSGWLARLDYERGWTELSTLAPTAPGVRTGVAVPGGPGSGRRYGRAFADVRRYNRLSADAQFNVRVVLGGWSDGGALPLQRRLSASGPGTLPGFTFRSGGAPDVGECSTGASLPGTPAQCDRVALAQVEYRSTLHFDLFDWALESRGWNAPARPAPAGAAPTRRYGGRTGGQWVLFADAGRGWLVGPASAADPRFVPAGRLPAFDNWRTDVGAGLDFEPIGLYLAKALSEPERAPIFFVRLHRRF